MSHECVRPHARATAGRLGALHGSSHPPQGLERALHSDADRLAGLWGLMIYERSADISVDQVEPEVRDVYRRRKDS